MKKYVIFFIFLLIILIIGVIIFFIHSKQKNKQNSLLNGMGYYDYPIFTVCEPLKKESCGYGKRKSIRNCIPHPKTLNGCIDLDGHQTFNPLVENVNCNLPCVTDLMTIKGTKTDISPLDKTSKTNGEYVINVNRVYDGINGLDMTNYYIGKYDEGDQNFLLKGKCIPNELENFYYKTYSCDKNSGVKRGKKGCIYTCGSDNQVTRKLSKSDNPRSYPIENGLVVCRDKYGNNIFNGDYYPDKCYNIFDGVSKNLSSLGKIYGKYSYYDINQLEEYSLDLSNNGYISTIGEEEICSVRSICDGTSGIKTLDDKIITYGVCYGVSTSSSILVYGGVSYANKFIYDYDSVTIRFKDNGTKFEEINGSINYGTSNGVSITYGYITTSGGSLVTSVLHNFYKGSDGVCRINNYNSIEPNIFNDIGWGEYKLNYSSDFVNNTVDDYGLSCSGFVTKGINFRYKSYYELSDKPYIVLNTGVCYSSTGTCSLYSQNCFGLHIYGTPVSKKRFFSDGTSLNLNLDNYSGYYYPVSIIRSRDFSAFTNDSEKIIYDTSLSLKEYPGYLFYISSSNSNSSSYYTGPTDNFIKNDAYKVLGTAEVKLNYYNIYGDNIPYSCDLAGRGYNCSSGIRVGLGIRIGVSELVETNYTIVDHIRNDSYLSKIDKINLIPTGYYYDLNERFNLYRSYANNNFVVSDKVNFVYKDIIKIYDSDIMKGAYKIDKLGNRENICYNDDTNNIISNSKIVNYNPGEVIVVPIRSNSELNVNLRKDDTGKTFPNTILDFRCNFEVDKNNNYPKQKDTNLQITDGCSVINFGMSVENDFLQLGYSLTEVGCKKNTYCYPTFYTNNKNISSYFLDNQDIYEVKNKELYYTSIQNKNKFDTFDSKNWLPVSKYTPFNYSSKNSIYFRNNYNIQVNKPGILISTPETYSIFNANLITTPSREDVIKNPFKSEDPEISYNFIINISNVQSRNKYDQIKYFLNTEINSNKVRDITTFFGNIKPNSLISNFNDGVCIQNFELFNENYYYNEITNLDIKFPTFTNKIYNCNLNYSNGENLSILIKNPDDELNNNLLLRKSVSDIKPNPEKFNDNVTPSTIITLNPKQEDNNFLKNIWGIYRKKIIKVINSILLNVNDTSDLEIGMFVLNDHFPENTSIVNISGDFVTLSYSGFYNYSSITEINFISKNENTVGYSLLKSSNTKFNEIMKNKILNDIYGIPFNINHDGIQYTSSSSDPVPIQGNGQGFPKGFIPFIIYRNNKENIAPSTDQFSELINLNKQYRLDDSKLYNLSLECSIKDYFTNKNLISKDNFVKPNINFISNLIYDLTIGRYIYSISEYIDIKKELLESFVISNNVEYNEINSLVKRNFGYIYTANTQTKQLVTTSDPFFQFYNYSEDTTGETNIIKIIPEFNSNYSFVINPRGLKENKSVLFINDTNTYGGVVTLQIDLEFNKFRNTENFKTGIYTSPEFKISSKDTGQNLSIEILNIKKENIQNIDGEDITYNVVDNFRIVEKGQHYGIGNSTTSYIWFDLSKKYGFNLKTQVSSLELNCEFDPNLINGSKLDPNFSFIGMYIYLYEDYDTDNMPMSSFLYNTTESYKYLQMKTQIVSQSQSDGIFNFTIFPGIKTNQNLSKNTNIIISTFDDIVFKIDNKLPDPSTFTELHGSEEEFNYLYNFSNKNHWYLTENTDIQNISYQIKLEVSYIDSTFDGSTFKSGYYVLENFDQPANGTSSYYLSNLGVQGIKEGRKVLDNLGAKIEIDNLYFMNSESEKYNLSNNNEYNYFYQNSLDVVDKLLKLNMDSYISLYNSNNFEGFNNKGFLSGMMEDYKYNIIFRTNDILTDSVTVPLEEFYAPNIIDVTNMIGMCTSAVELEIPCYGVLIPPSVFVDFGNQTIDFHDHIGQNSKSSKLFEVVRVYDKDDQNVYMKRNFFNTENYKEYNFSNINNTVSYLNQDLDNVSTTIVVKNRNINTRGYLELFNSDGTSREIISYTGIDDNLTLEGVSRGLFNIPKYYHNNGSCIQNITVSEDYMFWDMTNYNLFQEKYDISTISEDKNEISFNIPFEDISYETKTYLEDIYKGTLIVTEKDDGTKFLSSGICSSTGNYLIPNYISFYGVSTYVSKTLESDGVSITNFELEDNGINLHFSDGTSVTDLVTDKKFYLDNYQSNNYGILNFNESLDYVKDNTVPINSDKFYPLSSDKSSIGYIYEIDKKNEGGSFTNLGKSNILINTTDVYKIKIIEDPNNRMYITGNNLLMEESSYYGTSAILLNVIHVHSDGYVVSSGTSESTLINLETKLEDVVLGDAQFDPDTLEVSYTTDTTVGTSYVKFYPTVKLLYLKGKYINFKSLNWSGGPYLKQGDTNQILGLTSYNLKKNYSDYEIYKIDNDYHFIYIREDYAEYSIDYNSNFMDFNFGEVYNIGDYTKINFPEKEYFTYEGSNFSIIPKSYNLENNSTSYYNKDVFYIEGIEILGEDKNIYRSLKPNFNKFYSDTEYWEKIDITSKEPRFYDSSNGYMSFVLPDTNIETIKEMKDKFLENENNLAIKLFNYKNKKQYVPKMCIKYKNNNYQDLQNNLYIINLDTINEGGISPFLTLGSTPCSYNVTNPKIGSFSNCLGNPNDLFYEQYISMFNYNFVKDSICYDNQNNGVSIYELSNSLTFLFSPLKNIGPDFYKISSYFGYNYIGKITFIEYDSTPGTSLYPLIFSNYQNDLLFDKNVGVKLGNIGVCTYNYNKYEIFKLTDLGNNKYSMRGILKDVVDGSESGVSVCIMSDVNPAIDVGISTTYKIDQVYLNKIGVSYNNLYPVGELEDESYLNNTMYNYKILRQNITGHGNTVVDKNLVKCNYFFKFNKQLNDPLYINNVNFNVSITGDRFNVINTTENNISIKDSKFPINYFYAFNQTNSSNNERIKLVIKGTSNQELDHIAGTYDPDTNSIVGTCVHYYINNQEVLKSVYIKQFNQQLDSKYFKVNITSIDPGLCLWSNTSGTEYYELNITD